MERELRSAIEILPGRVFYVPLSSNPPNNGKRLFEVYFHALLRLVTSSFSGVSSHSLYLRSLRESIHISNSREQTLFQHRQ